MLGQLLDGRYKIIRVLGAGGFGQTFIAEDTKLYNSQCVVKQLKPMATDPHTLQVARRLFEAEIVNVAAICEAIWLVGFSQCDRRWIWWYYVGGSANFTIGQSEKS